MGAQWVDPAIRTVVILVFAWGIVAGQGHLGDVSTIDKGPGP